MDWKHFQCSSICLFNEKLKKYGYKIHYEKSPRKIAVRFEKITEFVEKNFIYYCKIIRKYLKIIKHAEGTYLKALYFIRLLYLIYFDDIFSLPRKIDNLPKKILTKIDESKRFRQFDEILLQHKTDCFIKDIKEYIRLYA